MSQYNISSGTGQRLYLLWELKASCMLLLKRDDSDFSSDMMKFVSSFSEQRTIDIITKLHATHNIYLQ